MILSMNFFFINETIGKNTRFENAYLSGLHNKLQLAPDY
jgi:hypothetical protein